MTTFDRSMPQETTQVITIDAREMVKGIALQGLYQIEHRFAGANTILQRTIGSFIDSPQVKPQQCNAVIDLCIENREFARWLRDFLFALNAEHHPQALIDQLSASERLASEAARHLALLRQVCEEIRLDRLAIHQEAIGALRRYTSCFSNAYDQFAAFAQAVFAAQVQEQPEAEREGGEEA